MKWSLATGDLPIRSVRAPAAGVRQYTAKYQGIQTFVDNVQNATKARPVITELHEVSAAMGQAIQAVLLGKAQPQQALDDAADQVNTILATGQ